MPTPKAKPGIKRPYRVFVSHAGDDIWVAEQIARLIENCGASAFLDRRDIVAGNNFRERIHQEMPNCDELLALFTPWSRRGLGFDMRLGWQML
jgi:TIR domain